MKKLIILRGVSGSGKTTFAKMLGYRFCEADMFFELDGDYSFDASKLGQAHEWCYNAIKDWLEDPTINVPVVVSNTSTTEKEVSIYVALAKSLGIEYCVVLMENWHGGESVHNVPNNVLSRQKFRISSSVRP